jgi:hypothetical protein
VRGRNGLAGYRAIRPSWVGSSSERGLASWIHDCIWDHLLVIELPDIGEQGEEGGAVVRPTVPGPTGPVIVLPGIDMRRDGLHTRYLFEEVSLHAEQILPRFDPVETLPEDAGKQERRDDQFGLASVDCLDDSPDRLDVLPDDEPAQCVRVKVDDPW